MTGSVMISTPPTHIHTHAHSYTHTHTHTDEVNGHLRLLHNLCINLIQFESEEGRRVKMTK